MSAINSNSSESDLEAIHRAQRAHEPSMEEILASIRNIIADDPAKGAAPKPQQTSAPMPQILYSKDDAAAYGDASGPSRRPEANAPTVVWRRPQAVEAEPAARRCGPAKRGAVAVAGSGRSGGLVVRGFNGRSRCSQRRARRQHGARHAPADGQAVAGRQSPDPRRAAGAGGNSEGRARAEVGSRLSRALTSTPATHL